jgi:cytochrome c553
MTKEAAARAWAWDQHPDRTDYYYSESDNELSFLAGDANAVKRLLARLRDYADEQERGGFQRNAASQFYDDIREIADWLEAQENQTNETKPNT